MPRPIVYALGLVGSTCATAISFPSAFEQIIATQEVMAPAFETAVRGMSPASNGGAQTVRLSADGSGHFQADLRINGAPVPALVDTGASLVALTAEDARRVGAVPAGGAGRWARMSTANGEMTVPVVTLHEIRLGDIVVRDVEAIINPPGTLRQTLLGMTFLRKLAKFEMASGRLNLTQ